MLNSQYVRSLMTYFAGFVSAEAINKLGKLPKNARLPEYDALISELQKVEKKANTGISNYIFSINEKYLSDNVNIVDAMQDGINPPENFSMLFSINLSI